MLRTLARISVIQANGEYTTKLVDVVASCRVAGYTFLIHRADHDHTLFTATYGPVGLSGGGSHRSIAVVITKLGELADRIPGVITKALETMALEHVPLFSPEEGIQTNDWQWREQSRFNSGEYLPVPSINGLEYPTAHYAHLSVTKTESDFVAYTPSESYGENDRQVRLKFGKYLRKTFAHLTDAEIQDAVSKLRSKLALDSQPASLHFATDRPTINQIFETEMCACDSTFTSCMHGKFDGDTIRPYHVYADSPDVAVAYVKAQGQIVSRTVVSTKNKQWVRTYAVGGSGVECENLKALLTQAGYTKGDLTGSRLTKLNTDNVMLPYIDYGGMQVSDCGDYWKVVTNGGDYGADQTDGTASSCKSRCSGCGNDEDDCECIYCECCEERYADGCDRCSMCPVCEGCTEHDNCNCSRCSHCSELLEAPRGYDSCRCDRCEECAELTADCECEICPDCGELVENCECEKEEETSDNESHPAGNAAVSAASSI